ncbi:hypothetical protein D7B24_003521 [Verticillium nonalfalfae]|uniref:Uncharacterized protein n=1 Tax=Verticillium nonalfalfae TaxID=1051616 RepID=A0A3M9YND6_9PEZI|nr:uncharacterized protein D7B24_003521 [Verticillium nonalfalfae]RNJ61108.1 hypothetical protein D7B24_003521 [Verticillium nonalfalfae]
MEREAASRGRGLYHYSLSGRPPRSALLSRAEYPLFDGDDTFRQVLQNIQRSVSRDACGLKPQRGLAADDIADEPWAYERSGTVEEGRLHG